MFSLFEKIFKFIRIISNNFLVLKVISLKRSLVLISLGTLTLILEAVGFISIVPIVELIQSGQDLNKFAQKVEYGQKLIDTFSYVKLSFNLSNLSIVFLSIFFLRAFISFLLEISFEKEKFEVVKRISIKLFSGIMTANAQYIKSLKNGGLTNICGQESERVGNLYRNIIKLFISIIHILAFISIMMYINFYLTTLALVILGFIAFLSSFLLKRSYHLANDAVLMRNDFYNYISEYFNLWKIIKFSDVVDKETKQIAKVINKYAFFYVSHVKVRAITVLLFAMAAFSLCIIILNLSFSFDTLILSELGLFSLILIRLIPLGQKFITLVGGLFNFSGSLDLAVNIYKNSLKNEEILKCGQAFNEIKHSISFKKIKFKFEKQRTYILKDLNLSIPAHKITAILGKSGAGKSTLVDLIPRIINPSDGKIFFDNINIKNINLLSLRKNISYVPQDIQLFEGTLKDNIKYFNPKASDRQMFKIIELAGLTDFVDNLEKGIFTIIKEKGANMSGGQKQRVSIARAFLSTAQILILDEPTSSLDKDNELKINLSIKSLQKESNKTVIIITHKYNALKKYDFVAYLEQGKILDKGKPAYIIGKYFKKI